MRYTVTDDGLLIVGSETGMVKLDGGPIVEKGRVGPGQMIGVDLDDGTLLSRTRELKDMLAARKPFGEWTRSITALDEIVKARATNARRCRATSCAAARSPMGYTLEDLELILHPMVEDAQGGRRLDGRRHAARRAVEPVSRPAPLSSARTSAR